MPKINRIRIANIEYDKKMIKDLFLDCYGGENVLCAAVAISEPAGTITN